jgi:hypothetical protein
VFGARNDRWIPFIVIALFAFATALGIVVSQSA